MMKIWTTIRTILTAPLTENLDTVHTFLLTGIVLVSIAAWLIILGYITRATEEI